MALGVCMAGTGKAIAIAATAFSLSWTHSVEKVEWREDYAVADDGIRLVEARVKGSGAGMEPGEGARLDAGWWVWRPGGEAVPDLRLAASGATASPWTFCHAGGCLELGGEPGAGVTISACDVAGPNR